MKVREFLISSVQQQQPCYERTLLTVPLTSSTKLIVRPVIVTTMRYHFTHILRVHLVNFYVPTVCVFVWTTIALIYVFELCRLMHWQVSPQLHLIRIRGEKLTLYILSSF